MSRPKETFDIDDFVEERDSWESKEEEIEVPHESLEDFLKRMAKEKSNKNCKK